MAEAGAQDASLATELHLRDRGIKMKIRALETQLQSWLAATGKEDKREGPGQSIVESEQIDRASYTHVIPGLSLCLLFSNTFMHTSPHALQ